MKIVIITNSSEGLYLFRRQLIKKLLDDGNEVIGLTPVDSNVDIKMKIGIALIDTKVSRRSINPFKDYILLKQYKKLLKKIAPSLVITYTIKPNIYGGIACSQLSIPFAVNVTGLGSALEKPGIVRQIAIFLNKIALKKAKIAFFENEDNRDFYINHGLINIGRTHVLHGAGVDLEYFHYQRYPNNSQFTFLFIGRIMKEKGFDELCDAVITLLNNKKKCILEVVGSLEEDYKDVIRRYESDGWLKYYGYQEDVRQFISSCDCFVLPSYHEGMANVNLECASSGRPIITTNIPGCRESVIDKVSGFLCEPNNVNSLYTAMNNIMALSRDQRVEMGQAGRQYMRNTFDKNEVVNETIEYLFK